MEECRHWDVELHGCIQDLKKAKSKGLAIQDMEVGLRQQPARGGVVGRACHLVFPEFATARNAHAVISILSTGCHLRHYSNGENSPVSLWRDTALSKLEWLSSNPSSRSSSDVFAFQRHY